MNRIWKYVCIGALFLTTLTGGVLPIWAQDAPYMDDRSGALEIVSSYFNAMNRREFARAWSYWREGGLGTNFEDFVEGYDEVTSSQFRLGKVIISSSPDEAESVISAVVFYRVPVVVAYNFGPDWSETLRGCFLLKLASPAVQSPPFVPLQIEMAMFELLEDARFDDVKPDDCGF